MQRSVKLGKVLVHAHGPKSCLQGPMHAAQRHCVWYKRAGQAAQPRSRQVLTSPIEACVWDGNGPEVVWGVLGQRWPCTEA